MNRAAVLTVSQNRILKSCVPQSWMRNPFVVRQANANAATTNRRSHAYFSTAAAVGDLDPIDIDSGVSQALLEGRPVVALESTIISHGMPYPDNLEMARAVESIVRDKGAVPATVAILEGRPLVGLTSKQLEVLAKAGPRARKCSRRDIAVAMAQGVDGATTVAATAYLASLAGIRVFVTGGMGGVHRGAESTFDVSADLSELAQTPIVVVCAGVKSILDVEKTLEVLETNGVPVVSYGSNDFPAFFSPSSGIRSPLRLDTPMEVAAAAKAGFDLGMRNGMVVAVPNPSPTTAGAGVEAATRLALEEAGSRGLSGREVTPFVLSRVNKETGGESLKSNIALVHHNAHVGTDIAIHLATLESSFSPSLPTSSPTTTAWQNGNATSTRVSNERNIRNIPSQIEGRVARGELPQQQPRPTTRVAVFGGAVADVVARPYPASVLMPGTSTPGEARRSFGGVGRNVAEGLARVLGSGCSRSGLELVETVEGGCGEVADDVDKNGDADDTAEVTLVSVVGADEAGEALVAACEDVGVKVRNTVEMRGSNCKETIRSPSGGDEVGDQGEDSPPRTASYVAVLGGDGELVAGVADMRVLDNMTSEFIDRHAGVVADASVVIADGNIPCEGFAQLARLCRQEGTPLVFEPTSVIKSVGPLAAGVATGITMVTPNLDELAAMAAAAGALQAGHAQQNATLERAGQKLAEAAISSDGQFVDARPLGDALRTVLTAMVHGEGCPATVLGTFGDGGFSRDATSFSDTHSYSSSSAQPESLSCSSLEDGSKHIVVTMGSAGVLVASASPAALSNDDNDKNKSNGDGGGRTLIEIPARSGSWFVLSADHYPALSLSSCSGGRPGVLVDCTGAGDCLVAGMVAALALGWEMRESLLLGLLCARESVQNNSAVPASLGDILADRSGVELGEGYVGKLASLLPMGYARRAVNPWSR